MVKRSEAPIQYCLPTSAEKRCPVHGLAYCFPSAFSVISPSLTGGVTSPAMCLPCTTTSAPPLPRRPRPMRSRNMDLDVRAMDADDDPAGEELAAEDVGRAEEGHRPEHEERERQSDAEPARNLGRLVELGPLLGGGGRGGSRVLDGVLVGRRLGVERLVLLVAALANVEHRLPVVVLGLKGRHVGQQRDEDEGREEGDDVADEHGRVGARRRHRDLARGDLRRDEPADERADEAEDWRKRGGRPRLAVPEESERGGDDGRRDDDAHEDVEVAHGDANVVEGRGEGAHEEGKDGHADVVHAHDLLASSRGVDECGDGTALSEQSNGGVGKDEAGGDLGVGEAVGIVSKAMLTIELTSGDLPHNVTGKGINRRSRDGLVVVTVVKEDSAKVADNVDDEELSAALRAHGQVAAAGVAADGSLLGDLLQNVPHGTGRTQDAVGRVHDKGEDEDDDQDDERVDVVGDEGGLDTAEKRVHNDAEGEDEDGGSSRGPRQVLNDGSTARQQHGRDENVGEATEDDEDKVGNRSIAGSDDFEKGVCVGRLALEFDGESRKQDDLDGGTGGVPKGTGDTTDSMSALDKAHNEYRKTHYR
ncbi:hypothetical protein BN1708_010152 [Verticillium longisporum]|uniref:Uncharacterized protein n=1 Tax=Verticillium longisporum TaxID=100787 RepID=A0A0G4KP20_VERLO|nr:hypothetical protein BN1708_010152 [Verticillium longisporum]